MPYESIKDEKSLYYGTSKSSNILFNPELENSVNLIEIIDSLAAANLNSTEALGEVQDFLLHACILFHQSHCPKEVLAQLKETEDILLQSISQMKEGNFDESIKYKLDKLRDLFDSKELKDYYKSIFIKESYYCKEYLYDAPSETMRSDRYISKIFETMKEDYKKIEGEVKDYLDFLEDYFNTVTSKEVQSGFLDNKFNAKVIWEFLGFDSAFFWGEESVGKLKTLLSTPEEKLLLTKKVTTEFMEKRKSVIEFMNLYEKRRVALNSNIAYNNTKQGLDLFVNIIALRLMVPMLKFQYNTDPNGMYAYNEELNQENIEKLYNNLYTNKFDIFHGIEVADLTPESIFNNDSRLPINSTRNDFKKAKALFETQTDEVQTTISHQLAKNLKSIIQKDKKQSKYLVDLIKDFEKILERNLVERPQKPLQVEKKVQDNKFATFAKDYSLEKLAQYNKPFNNNLAQESAEESEESEINVEEKIKHTLSFEKQIKDYNSHLRFLEKLKGKKPDSSILGICKAKNDKQLKLANMPKEDVALYKDTFLNLLIFKVIHDDSNLQLIPSSKVLIKQMKLSSRHEKSLTSEDLEVLSDLAEKGTFFLDNYKEEIDNLDNDIEHFNEEDKRFAEYIKLLNSEKSERYKSYKADFKGKTVEVDTVNRPEDLERDIKKVGDLSAEEQKKIKARVDEVNKNLKPIISALIKGRVSINKLKRHGEEVFEKNLNEMLNSAYPDIVVALFANERHESVQAKHFNKSKQLQAIYDEYSSCIEVETKDKNYILEAISQLENMEQSPDINKYTDYLKISQNILRRMQEIHKAKSKEIDSEIANIGNEKKFIILGALKMTTTYLMEKNIFAQPNSILANLKKIEEKRITSYGSIAESYNTASDWTMEAFCSYIKMQNKFYTLIVDNIKKTTEKTIAEIERQMESGLIPLTKIESEFWYELKKVFAERVNIAKQLARNNLPKNFKKEDLKLVDLEEIEALDLENLSPKNIEEVTLEDEKTPDVESEIEQLAERVEALNCNNMKNTSILCKNPQERCKKKSLSFEENVKIWLYGGKRDFNINGKLSDFNELHQSNYDLAKQANAYETLLGMLSLNIDSNNGELPSIGVFTKALQGLGDIYKAASESEKTKSAGQGLPIEETEKKEQSEKTLMAPLISGVHEL